jgi:hypothetical protein
VGCERSERREPPTHRKPSPEEFNQALKPKQPHPNPPLLSQGRGAHHGECRMCWLVPFEEAWAINSSAAAAILRLALNEARLPGP